MSTPTLAGISEFLPAAFDRRSFLASAMAAPLIAGTPLSASTANSVLSVPMDHDQPNGPRIDLDLFTLSPFDANRPTVFIVADGQQFFVAPGAFQSSLERLFDARWNVIGVAGRSDHPALLEKLTAGEEVNWYAAYRLLNSRQWIGDIEAARKALLGPDGKVMLYGRSGGGMLCHQYVDSHPDKVTALYTQAAVAPQLEERFGISSDHFWSELNREQQLRLASLLRGRTRARSEIAALFQRQNFFVPRSDLGAQREKLLQALEDNDVSVISDLRRQFQIDAIEDLMAGPRGPAIAVRLFELLSKSELESERDPDRLDPDIEVLKNGARPLIELHRRGLIVDVDRDYRNLQSCNARATIVAGRWDHTCDYRTQISLASMYPNAKLILLDDDHVFSKLKARNLEAQLVRSALSSSGEATDIAQSIEGIIWKE